MLRQPIEHHFTIEGESYLLRECKHGGQERLRREYALAIAAAPAVLETLDGANLLAQAVARQCLVQAPDVFWSADANPSVKKTAQANDALWELVTFTQVDIDIWEAFRKEVDAFVARLPQLISNASPTTTPAGPTDAHGLETPQDVSAVFRGRAE